MDSLHDQSDSLLEKIPLHFDFGRLHESIEEYTKYWTNGDRQELFDFFSECEKKYLLSISEGINVNNYYGLFSVFDNVNLFTECTIHDKEAQRKLLFTKKYSPNPNCINTKNEFGRYFDLVTNNMFLCMDWDNVLIAGGSILSLIGNVPSEYKKSDETLKRWFSSVKPFGDIDIFLYGLTDRQATKKIFEIYESIKKVVPTEILCVRGPRAITFVIGGGHRHVQIVFRNFKTVAEILSSFDVDSCAFGYDGDKVWCSPRSHHAITHSVNTVNVYKASSSYEYRLSKYGKRGFAVYVPNFTEENLNEQIYTRPPHQSEGLAKLLVLEKLDDNVKYQMYRDVLDLHQVSMRRNLNFKSTYEQSDYNKIYFPDWNSDYTINSVKDLLTKKHAELNKTTGSKPKYYCFVGKLNDVIVGKTFDYECDSKTFVNGRLRWYSITDSDFANLGIFGGVCNKTDGEDILKWYQSAYYDVNGNKNKVMDCVVGNTEQNELLSMLEAGKTGKTAEEYEQWKSKLVNSRDIANRVPLHQAIVRQDAGMVTLLLECGADVFYVSKLGKTALHMAAEVGNVDIVKALVDHVGKQTLVNPKDSYGLNPILYALMYGSTEVFKYLYGLESFTEKDLIWSFKYDDGKSYRALKMCLLFRQYEIAKFLLKKGYDINDYYKKGQYYKHILADSVESNDYEMFNLLVNHMNDQDDQTLNYELSDLHSYSPTLQTKYNKSKSDDDLNYYEKFITRLYEIHTNKNALYCLLLDMLRYHRFDRFKNYVKENSVNISLVCEGKSLLDETEARIKWIKQELDTFKQSIKLMPSTNLDQTIGYKYESGTIEVVDGEIFVIPQWIIKNEIQNVVNSVTNTKKEQKIVMDKTEYTKEQMEKKVEYSNENLAYYEKVKKYLEGKGVISMINTSKKTKEIIKSTPKTYNYLVPQAAKSITKSIKICIMSENVMVEDQQTYFELLNDISKGNDLTEYDLEKFDLNCYLNNSLMTPMKIALKNSQYGTFLILLKHIVEHKKPVVEFKKKIIRNNIKLKKMEESESELDCDEEEVVKKPARPIVNSSSYKINDKYYYNFESANMMSLIKSLSESCNECGFRYLINGMIECGVSIDMLIQNVWNIIKMFIDGRSYDLITTLFSILEERCLTVKMESDMIVSHVLSHADFEGSITFLKAVVKKYQIDNNILVKYLQSLKGKSITSSTIKLISRVIKLLLESGIDVLNTKYAGESVMTVACKNKNSDLIKLLIGFKANMDICDTNGYYPIHIVSELGSSTDIENILDQYPEEINRQSKEQLKTPLMLVSGLCFPSVTDLILKYEPNQTLRDVFGNTALHWAMIKSNINMVSKLVMHNSENYLRMTPIDYVINGMKSYFHHIRNKKLGQQLDSTKLPFIMQIYKKYAQQCLELDRDVAPYKETIITNKYILDSIVDGAKNIPEKLKI